MKRQLTKFLGVAVAMAMVIQVTSFGLEINSVHAFSLASEYEIVSSTDPEFEIDSNGTITEKVTSITSENGEAYLCDILLDGVPVAYTIRIDKKLVEYSLSPSPYSIYLGLNYADVIGYNYSEYFVIESERRVYLHQDGTIDLEMTEIVRIAMETPSYFLANVTIPGVAHNLQGQKNCIAASLSNILWYWGGNGYPSLRSDSWQTLLNTIHMRFGDNFANNRVHAVAESYARSRKDNYRIGGYVYWAPSTNQVQIEINAGRPCMVGFMKGSVYSLTVGHMTMCYGYYWSGSNFYLRLADGHKSYQVVRLWTSFNDCVISIRPSIYVGGNEPYGTGEVPNG